MGAALKPLEAWLATLETAGRRFAGFDPLDGGADARLLILLETPGPEARGGAAEAPRRVSRDNPTGTARNLKRFLAEAGLAREDTVLWNAVPWIVHAPGANNRALRRGEIAEGLTLLPPFLRLLPRLQVVVLAGRVAGQARATVEAERPDAAVLAMPHPSPTLVCTDPAIAARIRATLAGAAARLAGRAGR